MSVLRACLAPVLLLATASRVLPGPVEASTRPELLFMPNLGTQDPDVAFTVLGQDTTIELRSDRIRVAVAALSELPPDRHVEGLDSSLLPMGGAEATVDPRLAAITSLDLVFDGANPGVAPRGLERAGAVVSSFSGEPSQWKTGLPTHRGVLYGSLWDGIDMRWESAPHGLKYRFDVAPHVDARAIGFIVKGATDVAVEADGTLRMVAGDVVLRDAPPLSWHETADGPSELRSAWTVRRAGIGEWRVGFEVLGRDAALPLVIDPAVFVYGTFLGSAVDDRGLGVAVDGAGNAYICGEAPNGANGYDAYVAKYDATGNTLVYLGFIGGTGYDAAFDLAVDAAGQAFVTGSAGSTQPTFPAFLGPDVTHGGGSSDAFVAKLNAAGTGLLYCGFIGGDGFDFAEGIRVDAAGAAYVSGVVGSDQATFPVKVGPDLTYNGRYDTFVCKIAPSPTSANRLDNFAYSGYIGGRSRDVGVIGSFYTNGHIGIDAAGNAYVSGMTQSDEKSFPDGDGFGALPGWDKTHAGSYDGYVVKVNAAGTGLVYAGYIGGRRSDECFGMGIDAAGNAYVTGDTTSSESTFPVVGGPDLTYNGGRDAFVAKINSTGTALVYCGYIGGEELEQGLGLAADAAGNAFVIGHTHSSEATFPEVDGPDLTFNGTGRDVGDAYLARVSPTGTLQSCGYIGGSNEDSAYWVAVDGAGNAYVVGDTDSTGGTFPDGDGFGPIPGNNHAAQGGFDAFLVKIAP